MSSVLQEVNSELSNGVVFQNFAGMELQVPCTVPQSVVSTASGCTMRCKAFPSCRAGSYNKATARCCLSSLLAYEQGATYLENENSTYFQPVTDTVQYDNWTLVFRVLDGSGQETYATWTSTGLYHDHWLGSKDMELGCVSMDVSKPCNTLFRSRLLDDWDNLNVQKVRVSLFNNSLQVLNLIFDGRNSDYINWFSPDRVLESPWNDLYPDHYYNSFSLPGIIEHQRHFFINFYYYGCPGDTGWLMVGDKPGDRYVCDWESYASPVILFSTSSGAVTWGSSPTRHQYLRLITWVGRNGQLADRRNNAAVGQFTSCHRSPLTPDRWEAAAHPPHPPPAADAVPPSSSEPGSQTSSQRAALIDRKL
ncbi:uncharacterized protein LOC112572986 [Pomacea canaliculata]|uniref:uncharacterized protein LOC112572986 n=1 Tax=Pomacea canaliculata TaxID=400727 RepID=UPI000D72E762|nr:uncharacterized protein LOC112572986 [Pomacea canaliculata]